MKRFTLTAIAVIAGLAILLPGAAALAGDKDDDWQSLKNLSLIHI